MCQHLGRADLGARRRRGFSPSCRAPQGHDQTQGEINFPFFLLAAAASRPKSPTCDSSVPSQNAFLADWRLPQVKKNHKIWIDLRLTQVNKNLKKGKKKRLAAAASRSRKSEKNERHKKSRPGPRIPLRIVVMYPCCVHLSIMHRDPNYVLLMVGGARRRAARPPEISRDPHVNLFGSLEVGQWSRVFHSPRNTHKHQKQPFLDFLDQSRQTNFFPIFPGKNGTHLFLHFFHDKNGTYSHTQDITYS